MFIGELIKKGQFLFLEGDSRERIYFMLDGFVKLERVNQNGNLLYDDYVKRYSIFPYGGMFTDRGYNYTAEAMTDVEVYYIPTVIFEDMVKSEQNTIDVRCSAIIIYIKIERKSSAKYYNS